MRVRIEWPDGQVDRVEVNDCGVITYTSGKCSKHFLEPWLTAKAAIVEAGASVRAFEDGEQWVE